MPTRPSAPPTAGASAAPRGLLILIAVLVGLLVAVAAVWLAASTGLQIQAALLYGGGAFSGTTALIIMLMDKGGLLGSSK